MDGCRDIVPMARIHVQSCNRVTGVRPQDPEIYRVGLCLWLALFVLNCDKGGYQ